MIPRVLTFASTVFATATFLSLSNCSSQASVGFDPKDSGTAGTDSDATFDVGTQDGSASFGDGSSQPPRPACPEETQFVYTLSSDRKLWKFDPPKLEFSEIGIIDCDDSRKNPFSMAVDRKGFAWMVDGDGNLFRVNTKNAECMSTSFVPKQEGLTTFGMGFSTNAAGSDDETLFVSGNSPGNEVLAQIDFSNINQPKVVIVNAYPDIHARAELTGTGDGRLYGAFEGTPYVVAEINKTTAATPMQVPQTGVSAAAGASHFAFAFWGGDFWLFMGTSGNPTDVFQYSPAKQSTTKVKTVPFAIVGAGVSTCAPTSTPR